MLNDVFAGLKEAQSHLNLKHQVIDCVEDGDAGSHAGVPMLPLDGQKALEIVEYNGCLVGEKTIGEEGTLKVEALLRVEIKVQLVILCRICEVIELLFPFPANLGTGSVLTTQTERCRVVGALLSGCFNMGSPVLQGHHIFLDEIVLLGIDEIAACVHSS